jgi:enoyl-CoA hydratase/carnithine racemase
VPSAQLEALAQLAAATPGAGLRAAIGAFAAPFRAQLQAGVLETQREAIARHFSAGSVPAIMDALAADSSPFAREALDAMRARSPLMMCVTHELLRRGATLELADCLRMERSLVRRCFEHGEVLEGVRALVIDKDHAPRWNPPALEQVGDAMVAQFFEPVWPGHAHPLRGLAG